MAAGLVVLEESGGRVTDAHGNEILFDLGEARMPKHLYGVLGSSTPALHESLLGAFAEVTVDQAI